VPREAETSQADPFALPDQPILVTVRSAGPTAGDVRIATDSPTVGAVGSVSDLVETLAAARGPLLAEDQRFVLSPAPDASWAHTLAVYDAIARAGFTSIRLAEPGAAAAEVGR
jgi:biopolymer transport protein ExbD